MRTGSSNQSKGHICGATIKGFPSSLVSNALLFLFWEVFAMTRIKL
jgi:hypothetical protein